MILQDDVHRGRQYVQMEVFKALSVRQPWAELIVRGEKTVEYRSQSTKIRERVYVYASATKPDLTDSEVRQEVGCSLSDLPKGVLVGTVEIVDCIGSDGDYEWIETLREFERLPSSEELKKPEVMQRIVDRVSEAVRPAQGILPGTSTPVDIAKVVEKTIEVRNELSIDIPRIIVTPRGDAKCGYKPFKLNCSAIRLQPVSQDILIQHLQSNERYRLRSAGTITVESRLEDYIVRDLMDFDDVNYDELADMLYDLAGQMVRHLQSYLANKDDVINVLQAHQQTLVQSIYSQMQEHFEEGATEFDVTISRDFVTLRPNNYSQLESEKSRHYRTTVDDKLMIRGMLFHGFKKSLCKTLKFQSNSERIMATILESDETVMKWLKPSKGDFRIYYANDDEYIPDFTVETADTKYICEPKSRAEMTDPIVLQKARAATLWCTRATTHAPANAGKTLLIPHDALNESKTLAGLAATWEFQSQT